eukprot:TRINITY_DN3277_c0_g1_i1.p1 TRINITY_DN3277_c0_g1~~TRINITY_DN3277_c0_g1_i1.p1  ORF type:complete len:1303 (+),score=233.42 TRINITY_DN3277_c0_g1_i1:77-3985(+)
MEDSWQSPDAGLDQLVREELKLVDAELEKLEKKVEPTGDGSTVGFRSMRTMGAHELLSGVSEITAAPALLKRSISSPVLITTAVSSVVESYEPPDLGSSGDPGGGDRSFEVREQHDEVHQAIPTEREPPWSIEVDVFDEAQLEENAEGEGDASATAAKLSTQNTGVSEALALLHGASESTLSYGEALCSLDEYAKGRSSNEHAWGLFTSHMQAAIRVATWVVLLALPIVVWPFARYIGKLGTVQQELLSFWGSMLLQFLFCIGPTLGASMKYTLEGLLGTLMASLNMVFLNNVLSSWLYGGAYSRRIEVNDIVTNVTYIKSGWLPLCSTTKDLSYADCVFNIDWTLMPDAEPSKAAFVMVEFTLVVFVVLMLGFSTNVRVFCIATHVFYVMSYLDPTSGAFAISPGLALNYLLIVTIASVAVPLCFLFPKPITSTSRAQELTENAGSAVAMIIRSLPLTPSELCRGKVKSAMAEVQAVLADLDFHMEMMWFEDFGILKRRATHRRWLHGYAETIKASMCHVNAVLLAAGALPLSDHDRISVALPSLRHQCGLAGSSLKAVKLAQTSSEINDVSETMHRRRQDLQCQLATEFSRAQLVAEGQGLSPQALVFALVLAGVVADTVNAISCLTLFEDQSAVVKTARRRPCLSLRTHLSSLLTHLGVKVRERDITHPRFVLRNTLTIVIAFVLGWLGVSNVISSYSSAPAGTASVIMYTFTGASLPLTLRRLNGVVLGSVIGSVAQRLFAIQTAGHATCYALFLFVFVAFFVFHVLHSKQNSSVACLTVSYGVAGMIPGGGLFREQAVKITSSAGSFLFAKVVGTVLGVAVLLLVDSLLASSARKQARNRLMRSLNHSLRLVEQVLNPNTSQETCPEVKVQVGADKSEPKPGNHDDEEADLGVKISKEVVEDLDELVKLLPHAADEHATGGSRFPVEVYNDLENGLRTLAEQFVTMGWAIQMLETPQRKRSLRAGTRVITEAVSAKACKGEPLLRGEVFKPILANLAEELQMMLFNIKVLAADVTEEKRWLPTKSTEETEAGKVKRLLQKKLYTKAVGDTFCNVARSPWRVAVKAKEASAAKAKEAASKAKEAASKAKEASAAKAKEAASKAKEAASKAKAAATRMSGHLPSALDAVTVVAKRAGVHQDFLMGATLKRSNSDPLLKLAKPNAESSLFQPVAAGGQMSKALYHKSIENLRMRKQALQQLARQVRLEDFEENQPAIPRLALPPVTDLEKSGAKEGVADSSALRLLLIFENLRKEAIARRGDLPERDASSTLELVIFLIASVQTQIQHMQLSILQYSQTA